MTRLKKIFWISLLIKLIVAAVIPLTSDESYYWIWSHNLQWSYFDHPPVISWLFWLGHPFEDWLSMVRWPGVVLTHATLYVWIEILERWLNSRQIELWFYLALLSPLLGGTAFVITPDVPLLFFWSLSVWQFLRWSQKPTIPQSLLFGLVMGLGLSSKYIMVLFALSMLPVILLSPSFRRLSLRALPWITVGALVGFAPVLYWNFINDFQSFRFQLDHGVGRTIWKPSWTYEYVLLQIAVIFPIVFYFAIKGARKAPPLFRALSFVPLVFFVFTSYRGYVEANWPVVAYPSLFYLAILGSHGRERLIQMTAWFWGALFAVAFGLIVFHHKLQLPETRLNEFTQFDSLSRATINLDPLFTRSYQMASTLQFKQRRPIYKLRGMNRPDFFDFLKESDPATSQFFLAVEIGDRLPSSFKDRGYQIVERTPIDTKFEVWRVAKP